MTDAIETDICKSCGALLSDYDRKHGECITCRVVGREPVQDISSGVERIVSLRCECGADFTRKEVPADWMEIHFYKMKFKYCDTCFRARQKQALKRLPEILKALADEAN